MEFPKIALEEIMWNRALPGLTDAYFSDVTRAITFNGLDNGGLFADYDADGDVDLYATRWDPTSF